MSTDIQQARDVLAKWRGHSMIGNWAIKPLPLDETFYSFDLVDDSAVYAANTDEEAAARLIVGTAGNPGLLDAIDLMLHCAQGIQRGNAELVEHAGRIAAAIIAADQRMTS